MPTQDARQQRSRLIVLRSGYGRLKEGLLEVQIGVEENLRRGWKLCWGQEDANCWAVLYRMMI